MDSNLIRDIDHGTRGPPRYDPARPRRRREGSERLRPVPTSAEKRRLLSSFRAKTFGFLLLLLGAFGLCIAVAPWSIAVQRSPTRLRIAGIAVSGPAKDIRCLQLPLAPQDLVNSVIEAVDLHNIDWTDDRAWLANHTTAILGFEDSLDLVVSFAGIAWLPFPFVRWRIFEHTKTARNELAALERVRSEFQESLGPSLLNNLKRGLLDQKTAIVKVIDHALERNADLTPAASLTVQTRITRIDRDVSAIDQAIHDLYQLRPDLVFPTSTLPGTGDHAGRHVSASKQILAYMTCLNETGADRPLADGTMLWDLDETALATFIDPCLRWL